MYIFDDENKIFVFSGDLKKYLLDYGIDNEHIEKMQKKILQKSRDDYQDYPATDSPEYGYTALVPLDKVIGVSRGTVGLSVYENVRTMQYGDREPSRFEDCFSYLDKLPLEDLKKSYTKLRKPVDMDYYTDDDEYYLSNDGNHRTLVAMLVGAEYILARVTNAYCNEEKKKKYFCKQNFYRKYNIETIVEKYAGYAISFKDGNGVYEIANYPSRMNNEDTISYFGRLSKMIDEDIAATNRIKKMPSLLQKAALHFTDNRRIEQYMNKRYLSREEMDMDIMRRVYFP